LPANTSPIFALTPNSGGGAATAANTVGDGGGTVGTDIFKVYTAGANGSYVSRIRIQPVASVAATSTTATVLRVFKSTVTSGATTNANTFCVLEVALASVSADHSTAATNAIEFRLDMMLASGEFIHITNHAAPAANTRWQVTFPGSGDF
jgi:hypothetical protein